MATPDYTVDMEDERFDQVDNSIADQEKLIDQSYGGMIDKAGTFYKDLQNQADAWGDKQTELQNQQTNLTIEQINQQKEQAQKDYIKEQSGAYVDWRKQSNEYGVEAEKMAASGLANTGYSESSQVAMYNQYQNRVASAREVYSRAVLDYDNDIKEAQLQNSVALAEIANTTLQKKLELALEGFQYENQLIDTMTTKKIELENTKWNRYQDVLDQINTENAMAEEVRQFNQNYELQVKSLEEEIRQYNQDYAEKVRQFDEEIARLKAKDAEEARQEAARLELQKQQLQQAAAQHQTEMEYKYAALEEEKRQFDTQQTNRYSYSGSNGSSSGVAVTNSAGQIYYLYDSNIKAAISSGSINQSSLEALELGPVSNNYLISLVESGKISVSRKNGQYYLNWANK